HRLAHMVADRCCSGIPFPIKERGRGKFVARVMVVEDNPNLLALFTHVLVRAGHAVTPCRDAAAALDQVRETPPDLVITDFDLPPGMTGLHLVRALRSSPATANIPIMMVAGADSGMSA